MTVEITPDTDDLDAFEQLMFGQTPVQEAPPEDVQKEEALTPVEEEEEIEEAEEPVEEEGEAEPEPEKPKKNRFQERIDELTTARREAERREAEMKSKLDEILAKLEPKDEVKAPVKEDTGPSPDDIGEDGEPLYPLGEFDKNYIRDLARHSIKQETEAQREIAKQEAEKVEVQKAQEALRESWSGKLEDAFERYPDMQEKNAALGDTFSSIDQQYGEFLAATIMSMDYGVDVLYHLGSNPDEAKNIVNSGAEKALVALGRLEARFAFRDEEAKDKKLKVSKAPEPPTRLNKGTSVSQEISPDTDDLDAFERQFYKRR